MSGLATVILAAHILIALGLIAVVLLQRSEGGALGIGGGAGSFMTARGAGNVLTRTTTILAIVFFLTSLSLTLLGRQRSGGALDLEGGAPASVSAPQSSDTPASPLPALPSLPGGASAPAPVPDATLAPTEAAPTAAQTAPVEGEGTGEPAPAPEGEAPAPVSPPEPAPGQ